MPNFERAKKWIDIATRDLKTAKALVNLPEPDFYFVSFACQQSAEKSIKSFLSFHNQRILKTHKIEQLLAFVDKIDPKVSKELQDADQLSVYAIASRYPDFKIKINKKTTGIAVDIATNTLELISKIVSECKI